MQRSLLVPWRAARAADPGEKTAKPRRRHSTAVKRRVRATLVLLTALLALCVGAGIYAAVDLYRSAESRYVRQALPLRTATRDLVLQMVNEETGVRGYMISRQRSSLEPYFAGVYGVGNDLSTITRLGRNDRQLLAKTKLLRMEIASVHHWLAKQIAFVADSPAGQLQAQRDLPQGQARFTRFRRTATAVSNDVDRFVQATRRRQRRTFVAALTAIVGAGVGALLISLTLLRRFPERMRLVYAAEEEARFRAEEEANAARALAHIRDAVVLLDDDGLVRLWNPAAEELFGVAAPDVLDRPAAESVPALAGIELAAREAGSLIPVDLPAGERWVTATETRFEGGRVLAVRDLTAEHDLERMRADFVATASHELRTPVTAVYGAAETLAERSDSLSPATRGRLMQVIEQEARRLADITDQMLSTARLDQGRLTGSPEECDVLPLCRNVVESARFRQPEGGPIVLVSPRTVEPVTCDPHWLRQVVVNLLDNAVKYSPDGGRIELRVVDQPEAVRIEVTDQGLGIAREEQERIFDKFYRVDPHMTRGIGGSGLGLYLSRQLVTRMGGRLDVTSELGSGSTFTIELPRAPDRAAPVDAGAAVQQAPASM